MFFSIISSMKFMTLEQDERRSYFYRVSGRDVFAMEEGLREAWRKAKADGRKPTMDDLEREIILQRNKRQKSMSLAS